MGRTKQRRKVGDPKEPTSFADPRGSKVRRIEAYDANQDLNLTGQDLFELQQDTVGLDEDATALIDADDDDRKPVRLFGDYKTG